MLQSRFIVNIVHYVAGLALIVCLSNCGKHEASTGTMGTATGAIIGASVAGRHDKATGAIIGGLVGNIVGRTIGQDADEQEREEAHEFRERQHARERARTRQELARAQEENRRLSQQWCDSCGRQVSLAGAHSCPSCGGELIRERYCKGCSSRFSPECGYRYCPFCKSGIKLNVR